MSIITDDAKGSSSSSAWIALLLLCLPTAVLALDMSALYLALPSIASSFETTAVSELWILDIYPLFLASFLIPMGGLCDRWTNRRVLLIGAVSFVLISIINSLATSALLLIIFRAIIGIAGAALMPATLGLIRDLFDNPETRQKAIAIWTSAFMTGFAVGPVIGGYLLDSFGWRSIFLLAVPLMLPLIITSPMVFPKRFSTHSKKQYDWLSSILFLAMILPLVHGLKSIINTDTKLVAAACLFGGVVVGFVFTVRQLKVNNPLLDLRMIVSDSKLTTALAILLLGSMITGGLTLFISQYLQLIYKLSPTRAGILIAPASFGLIVGALLSPGLSKKTKSAGSVIGLGFLVVIIGLITMTVGVNVGPIWVISGFIIVYFGCGPYDALGTDIVISLVPKHKSASAGAAAETAVELGIGLGIALFGSLGTAVYRKNLAAWMIDEGLDKSAVDRALSSFSVAMSDISAYGDIPNLYIQKYTSSAFASSLMTVAGSNIVLALLLSLLAFAFLRKTT